MGWEAYVSGGGASFDADRESDDWDSFSFGPGVRFGVTDRLALSLDVPFVGFSAGDVDESGLGDMIASANFLFFEDIFEYAWVIPHAAVSIPTGDEDKGLGEGDAQGRLGLSIGTTVMDVLHWGADLSYTSNGSHVEEDEDLAAFALSLIWDLDNRSSVFGEVKFRDDPVDSSDDFAMQYHLGLAYRINDRFTLMGYGGSTANMDLDFYGSARLVCQF